MDLSVFFKLFDAQVKPMLLYASEVWGITQYKVIEAVHLFACKKLLNVSPRTPNTMVYGETGRYPLYIDSTIRAIGYWFRLQDMDLIRIPKQAFVSSQNRINFCADGLSNWAKSVKNCFDIYGFSEVWLNGGVGNAKVFMKVFRQRMVDCYQQDWTSKLNSSERFQTYRSFKSLLQPEQYLTDITINKFRVSMIKFRLGISDLRVNNRYRETVMTCPFCDHVENEMHFLIHCETYSQIRNKYIFRHRQFNSNHPLQLKCLLENENTTILRDVAMYIYYAFKKREELTQLRLLEQ